VTEEPELLPLDEILEIHDDQVRLGSVFAFDHEERATNRAGQLRFLLSELESRRELGGHFHAVGELEPNGPLLRIVLP
jgi:hypothetical protein